MDIKKHTGIEHRENTQNIITTEMVLFFIM